MAAAIDKFKKALTANHIDDTVVARIFEGFEKITDNSAKEKKAAFFTHAMKVMDELLDYDTRYRIRDACACCTGGWRENAVRKFAREGHYQNLDEQLQALSQLTHMGSPVLNADGTITAGIGGDEGCQCACFLFGGRAQQEAVSPTYCLCCAGHFRYHYQIALGKKLRTKAILSTALESFGKKPCRFVYEIEE